MAGIPVISANGELVHATLTAFEQDVEPFLNARGPGLIFDLSRVEFVSSLALGFFVRVGKTLEEQGRVLVLARVLRPVERVLRQIGLDSVLPLFRSVAEATVWIQARGSREL